jgi:hypothetical protein
MNVIYNTTTGSVVALGSAVASNNESSVKLDESQITRPIDGTVVDDVTNPSKTVPDLSEIKSQKKSQIKNEAYSLLEKYDWYVIRKQEEGTVIPTEVSQYRSDVRTTEDDATAAVEAATSASEVRSIEPNWPDEPNV